MREVVDAISMWAVPILLLTIPLIGILRGVKVYEVFVEGAKEGFDVAIRVIPFLVALLVAIGMFRASGAMAVIANALSPVLSVVHFPVDLLPLAIFRSLSGPASLALVTDIIKTHGPEALVTLMACTMYGSSETTFYVIALYFGSVGIRKTRQAIPVALSADFVAVVASVAVCLWMFT